MSEETAGLAIDVRVRVYPGDAQETGGVIVEDYGSAAGQPVVVGDELIVASARRWAVLLDDGTLVFADSGQLAAENIER
ncbi:hypothetical protein [Mycobacterium sp. C31M]